MSFSSGVQYELDSATHALDSAEHTSITGRLVPIGALLPYGGAAAPDANWLLCDGAAVSRTTYAGLFAVFSTAFGVGDGSTTFNLPDLRGRAPLGKATSGTGSTLGGTGGAIDHTHTGPSHTHTGPSHDHSVTLPTYTCGASDNNTNIITTAGASSMAVGNHLHSITPDTNPVTSAAAGTGATGAAGTGASGTANLPFQAVNYIVRAL